MIPTGEAGTERVYFDNTEVGQQGLHYHYHFAREGVQRGDISIKYVKIKFQLTDIFTKALDSVTSIKFRDMLEVSVRLLS